MITVAALVFTGILAALAVLQLALVAGAPLGEFAWGGADRVLPARKRIGSAVAIVLYALFAWLFLMRAGLLPLVWSELVVVVGCWVIVAYLALGAAMNAVSRSPKERFTMTPVTLVLLACAIVVAIG